MKFIPNKYRCVYCGEIIKEKHHSQKHHNPAKRPDVRKSIRQHYGGGVKHHTLVSIELIKRKNKGKKRSLETKLRLSQSKKKEKNPNFGKKFSIEEAEKMSCAVKQAYINNPHLREVKRTLAIKRIEQAILDGRALFPVVGKQEKFALDIFEEFITFPIKRQFPVGGYFLDGYCSFLNLAFEIDEEYHKKRLLKDIRRQEYIENKLGCKFIRIEVT